MRVRVWMTPAWHRSHGAADYTKAVEFSQVAVYSGVTPDWPAAGALVLKSARCLSCPGEEQSDLVLPWHMVNHAEAV